MKNISHYFMQDAPEHASSHERKQLKWFLLFVVTLLLLTGATDLITTFYDRPQTVSQNTAPESPKPTQLIEFITPTPLISTIISPTPTIPVNKMCGGIANSSCPKGYMCKLDGFYPDASGTCIKQ